MAILNGTDYCMFLVLFYFAGPFPASIFLIFKCIEELFE